LAFGIPKEWHGPDADEQVLAEINAKEAEEVHKRREHQGIQTAIAPEGHNTIGVGYSGGGIRSATFCLGVTQVLAERRLLKEVDFLSTVSGGGYTGCFLTTRLGSGADHGPTMPR
jgi:hypothetical protein